MPPGNDKQTGTFRSRNGVTLAGDVLTPRGSTVGEQPDRGSVRRPDRAVRVNWPMELLRIAGDLTGILIGLLLIGGCIGIAYMGRMMVGVLNDISQRDYSQAATRVDRYNARFDAMSKAGFKVQRSEPKILNGETSYLWVVTPVGSDDRIVYRWKHYLKTNTVEPLTNPSLLLDIAMGYERAAAAGEYGFYNPNDKLAQAMARRDFGSISPDQIAERWSASQLPSGPVLQPILSPEKARGRRLKPDEEDPEALAGGEAAANAAEGSRPGESTDVGGGSRPPEGGEDTEVGGGDAGSGGDGGSGGSSGGGGSTPPHDDAIPVG